MFSSRYPTGPPSTDLHLSRWASRPAAASLGAVTHRRALTVHGEDRGTRAWEADVAALIIPWPRAPGLLMYDALAHHGILDHGRAGTG